MIFECCTFNTHIVIDDTKFRFWLVVPCQVIPIPVAATKVDQVPCMILSFAFSTDINIVYFACIEQDSKSFRITFAYSRFLFEHANNIVSPRCFFRFARCIFCVVDVFNDFVMESKCNLIWRCFIFDKSQIFLNFCIKFLCQRVANRTIYVVGINTKSNFFVGVYHCV